MSGRLMCEGPMAGSFVGEPCPHPARYALVDETRPRRRGEKFCGIHVRRWRKWGYRVREIP